MKWMIQNGPLHSSVSISPPHFSESIRETTEVSWFYEKYLRMLSLYRATTSWRDAHVCCLWWNLLYCKILLWKMSTFWVFTNISHDDWWQIEPRSALLIPHLCTNTATTKTPLYLRWNSRLTLFSVKEASLLNKLSTQEYSSVIHKIQQKPNKN